MSEETTHTEECKHEVKPLTPIEQETWDRMTKARYHMFMEHPFFGEIASYIRPKPSNLMDTACITNKGEFLIYPEFANKATASDFVFILAHEAMHIVNGTLDRFPKGGNQQLWNAAGDIAINYLIVNAGINLPREELIKPLYKGFEEYFGQTHEEIYEKLMKNAKAAAAKMKGKWVDESCTCEEFFEGMSEGDKATWVQRISSAAESARQAGKLPGNLEHFIAKLSEPKRNWKRILRLSVQSYLKKTFTWRKPNKRTMSMNIVTPGRVGQAPEVVVYIDTSGSISDANMNEALSEVTGILQAAGGVGQLILGDAVVYYFGEIDKKSLTKLPVQRGGTDFNPVFEAIEEKKLKPKVFIGFSDLCGPFPAKEPPFKVLWVRPSSYQTATPPWGKTIDAVFGKN